MDNVSVLFPPSPPVITTQPASQIVTVGASATFTVTATGPPPVNYFWSRNGVFIAGATASNYTTNNVQLSDSGSQFSCLVSNTYGTTLSSNAVLTVISPPGSSRAGPRQPRCHDYQLWWPHQLCSVQRHRALPGRNLHF